MTTSDGKDWPGPALIARIIAYLDDREDPSRVWKGLRFMEAHGIDPALRSVELHAYLTSDQNSPLEEPSKLTLEDERRIVLALREAARREQGIPPLSEAEKTSWVYEAWQPRFLRTDAAPKQWSQTHHPTADEVEALIHAFAGEFPVLMRAITSLYRHNATMPLAEKESDLWLQYPWSDAIAKLRPDLDGHGVQNLKNEMKSVLRKNPDAT